MTTLTHQLLSRKKSTPEVWQCECDVRTFQPQCYMAVLRMGYAEVVFIQPGGKLDTMWRGAWQKATRHQGVVWPLQMVIAAGRCSLSHRQKHTNSQCENLQFTLAKHFFLQNSPDLNTVNLPSGVIFSRRSTTIIVSPQLTKRRQRLSKACMKLPRGAVIAISSLLSPFYLRLMLFARWRHYFSSLIQINYGMMFRMKRPWFLLNLVKICSIFLKL